MRLGIDFGTTRTVVAAVLDGRHPVVAFDDGGEFREHVPGTAAVCDGELVVGWAAARALAGGGGGAIRSIKRVVSALAPDEPVPGLGGTTALELVVAFLADLRTQLLTRSNLEVAAGEPLEVMVAVPANSASRQRWLTLEAFRRAGFQPVGLLNEPTAAAVELAHRHLGDLAKRSPKRYVVVYDLGGGTFDASAVSLEGRSFDLIASEGVARLGGDDFDELILEAAGVEVTPFHLERAREAKEALRPTSRKLHLELGPERPDTPSAKDTSSTIREPVAVDLHLVYERAQPLIDRTLEHTELLMNRLRDRGIDPDDPRELGGIYLVGGAAAFPAVGKALRARFGKKLQLAPQPFAATAVGLAIAADPGASVIIREAITRHFGVWREAEDGVDKVFDPLLGKGAGAPAVVERRYRPTHTIGHLRFLECGALDEGGQPVQDIVPWADVYFPYDPALASAPAGDLGRMASVRRTDLLANEIAETYTYAADGTISVTIANLSHAYARTFSLGALR
ncbi:MAG: Hsp70 family protein [Deltaproteobacteria bacterium]|nr:Hsp70 family protein [Deltaproteobacteria bacterium]